MPFWTIWPLHENHDKLWWCNTELNSLNNHSLQRQLDFVVVKLSAVLNYQFLGQRRYWILRWYPLSNSIESWVKTIALCQLMLYIYDDNTKSFQVLHCMVNLTKIRLLLDPNSKKFHLIILWVHYFLQVRQLKSIRLYLKKDNFLPFQFHGFCDEFEMFK